MPLEGMLSTGRSLTQTQIPFHQCPFVAMKLPVGPTHFLEKDVGLCWTTQHLLTSILIRILMKLLVGPSEDQRSHGRRVVTLSKKNVSWSQTQIHNNYPLIPSSLWFRVFCQQSQITHPVRVFLIWCDLDIKRAKILNTCLPFLGFILQYPQMYLRWCHHSKEKGSKGSNS